MRPLSTRSGFWLYFVLASLGVFLVPGLLSAATYIVPPDAEMIREADTIAIVTIQSSHSYWTDDGRAIATDYEAIVESPLKNGPAAGSNIVITQRGGSVGNVALSVSSQPLFFAGERTLVMLRRLPMRRFTTLSGELGKFSFVRDAKWQQLLVRNATKGEIFGWDLAGQHHVERSRDAAAFLRYIEAITGGENAVMDYDMEESKPPFRPIAINSHVPGNDFASQFTINLGSPRGNVTHGARWPGGALPMQTVGTQSGVTDLGGSITAAREAWNGEPNSVINISIAGTGTGTYRDPDGQNLIFFDQPDSGFLAGSVVGEAYTWVSDSENTNGSDTYFTMFDCDIIVQAGFTGTQFEAILSHEMGHCIGFRHSNQPQSGQTTFSTDALMYFDTTGATATLKEWDQLAASHVYGNSVTTCNRVTIPAAEPADRTITAGQSTILSVTPSGTGPFTYQWFVGSPPDSTPFSPGGTSSSINVSPTTTTTYWVRVTGCEGSVANSRVATVTVNPPTCTPPSISGQPQSQTITAGNSTSLSVSASGTAPFSYQWFMGAFPSQSQIQGATNAFLQVSPTTTTSYWVRVTGQCAPAVDSNTATITVTADTCPEVNVQSPTAAKQTNGSYLLDVVATSSGGSLIYQWFQGAVPGAGTQIGTGRPFSVPAPTAPTSYWVRVFNNCNKSANSPTVVTIAPCDLPVIGTEPGNQSIANGASATLTVAFTSATAATVRWYRGTAPDKTNEVGVGATLNTGPLTATTQFWASITNSCGEKFTRTATVTVGSACTAPAILTTSTAQTKLKGETVTLNVNASGTAQLHYQWYEGVPGDVSHPVGTDASSFTSAPLTKTTQFWVRVTNTCGNAPSGAIGVTVLLPRSRAVRH